MGPVLIIGGLLLKGIVRTFSFIYSLEANDFSLCVQAPTNMCRTIPQNGTNCTFKTTTKFVNQNKLSSL